jgi:hypothetical protein
VLDFNATDDFGNPSVPPVPPMCTSLVDLPSVPDPCIAQPGEDCVDACAGGEIVTCQGTDINDPHTYVDLDGGACTLPDLWPDNIDSEALTFNWLLRNCPQNTGIVPDPVSPWLAQLSVPSDLDDCDDEKTCEVVLQVTESYPPDPAAVCPFAEVSRTVRVLPAPLAEAGGVEQGPTDPEGEYRFCETEPYQIDGTAGGCYEDPPGTPEPVTVLWSLGANCPPSADLSDFTIEDPIFIVDPSDIPVECTLTMTVTGQLSQCERTDTALVRVCGPDAHFSPLMYLDPTRCEGGTPPVKQVLHQDESRLDQCEQNTVVTEHWEFEPDATPAVWDAPPDGPVGDDVLVQYVDEGIKESSLEVCEDIRFDPADPPHLCCDTFEECFCLPECAEIDRPGNPNGIVLEFTVDCGGGAPGCNTPSDGDFMVDFEMHGMQDCCPGKNYVLDPLYPWSATVEFACGGPTVSVEAVWLNLVPMPPDDRFIAVMGFETNCIINAIQAAGCTCDSFATYFNVDIDFRYTCDGSTCPASMPIRVDQDLGPFSIKCTDQDCLSGLPPNPCPDPFCP